MSDRAAAGAVAVCGWVLLAASACLGCGGTRFTSIDELDGGDTGSDAEDTDASRKDDAPGPEGGTLDAGSHDGGAPDGTVSEAEAPDANAPETSVPDASGAEAEGPDAETDAAEDAATDAPDAPDAPDDAADADSGCTPVLVYQDGDGDGYGGTTTAMMCAPGDGGTWVTIGGDCDDSNPTVNPGQKAYFAAGYVPTGGTAISFDYDCSGQETESGSPAKAACGVVNLSCQGSGYVEASPARSGGGVDPFCGSDEAVTCAFSGLSCQAGAPHKASPIACH